VKQACCPFNSEQPLGEVCPFRDADAAAKNGDAHVIKYAEVAIAAHSRVAVSGGIALRCVCVGGGAERAPCYEIAHETLVDGGDPWDGPMCQLEPSSR